MNTKTLSDYAKWSMLIEWITILALLACPYILYALIGESLYLPSVSVLEELSKLIVFVFGILGTIFSAALIPVSIYEAVKRKTLSLFINNLTFALLVGTVSFLPSGFIVLLNLSQILWKLFKIG